MIGVNKHKNCFAGVTLTKAGIMFSLFVLLYCHSNKKKLKSCMCKGHVPLVYVEGNKDYNFRTSEQNLKEK